MHISPQLWCLYQSNMRSIHHASLPCYIKDLYSEINRDFLLFMDIIGVERTAGCSSVNSSLAFESLQSKVAVKYLYIYIYRWSPVLYVAILVHRNPNSLLDQKNIWFSFTVYLLSSYDFPPSFFPLHLSFPSRLVDFTIFLLFCFYDTLFLRLYDVSLQSLRQNIQIPRRQEVCPFEDRDAPWEVLPTQQILDGCEATLFFMYWNAVTTSRVITIPGKLYPH